jgi:endo-1,4-beta-D-glucanase Y
MLNKIKTNWLEIVAVTIVLLIAGLSHGYNMFQFPYYENDEGTYMSQAWSVVTQGKMAPYTYWYDHSPAGWILMGIWAKLTGGFFTFGASVNSGRVLMLILHLGISYCLYFISKKLSGSKNPGIVAILIFSLTPLGIYFQRRVLLDNIMIFWVFVSLALLYKDKLKLSTIIASSIAYGIAVLTKENAIFFIPAFVYVLYTRAHNSHKILAIVKWLAVCGLIVSFYFLYALLKRELFPVGFFGDDTPHVSLITTLQEQFSRGGGYIFFDPRSDFYTNLLEWFKKDRLTITLGAITTCLSVIFCTKVKSLRVPALFAVLFWIFLMRGKLVLDFYIVPLIPLLTLNTALILNHVAKIISFNHKRFFYVYTVVTTLIICGFYLINHIGQYTRDETTPQVETIEWIKSNLPTETKIVIDSSIYVDLHAARYSGDKVFPNAQWAWKVEKDSEITQGVFKDDWKNIEYIALSHEILKQVKDLKFSLIQKALDSSALITEWRNSSTSYIDVSQYISTNGDWMAIYKVKDKNTLAINTSWKYFKSNFIKSYGQVIDPGDNNKTTSEGQSYALLRAVWLNDKETFDGVWAWTKDHLQYRTQDSLISWLWIMRNGEYKLGDSASASDADQDIALALFFAYKRWGDEDYLRDAREIIRDIWIQEVVQVNQRYYLISGTDAAREDGYLVNPSYLSPASYKIFAQVDNTHPWSKLADDSYFLLDKLGTTDNSTYLPPNWILIDRTTGEVKSASNHINDKDSDNYGFDAFRTLWRVALDIEWFESNKAKAYFSKVYPIYEESLSNGGTLFAVYNLDGEAVSEFESLSTKAAALSVFRKTNPTLANSLFEKYYLQSFNYDDGYWGDKNNYYDQNWAWFATALYTDNLPNLWANE